MSIEYREAVDQCMVLSMRLLAAISSDMVHMEKCVHGDILREYRRSMELAEREAQNIRQQIAVLRDEASHYP